MAKYSIILPVRNGGHYVKECVESILNQSMNDFNLLVLDNCSSDGTPEWINSLKDDRISVIPADRPLTIEENWSRIIHVPKNEFITLIGHDDLLFPHYLESMDELIRKHPQATLYQSHFRYIDSKGALIRACKPMDEIQSSSEFLGFFLCSMIDVMGTGFMMRAQDYDRIGGIPPRYPNLLFADFELVINLTGTSYKATSSKECFAFRLHQSTTTTSPDLTFHKSFGVFIEYLLELKKKKPEMSAIIEKYSLDFLRYYTKGLSHRLLRTPKSKRSGMSVKVFLQQCKRYADQLVPGNNFHPEKEFSVKLAGIIDSNPIYRSMFLRFKKTYSKPIYS